MTSLSSQMLGWTEIEVSVVSTEDDYDHLAKSLVENVQRKQLTWQEEVRFVQELHQLMQARYGRSGDIFIGCIKSLEPWKSDARPGCCPMWR